MKYVDENFLLQTPSARKLYFDYAENRPIIDYHSHLPAGLIAGDHVFANISQMWLAGDHYKWRAMRAVGIPERLITGDAGDWDKFLAWAEVVPQTLRNPLYHWTHLELRKYFGIDDRLFGPESAPDVWKRTNAMLKTPEFSTRNILKRMNVKWLCTTDDPIDSLAEHETIARDPECPVGVYPTFRPDRALHVPGRLPEGTSDRTQCVRAYLAYLERLEAASRCDIRTYEDFLAALRMRHDYFHERGCRLSDHGFGLFSFDERVTTAKAAGVFSELRAGKAVSIEDEAAFRSAVMIEIGKMNAEKSWTMQLHLGALRNNNSRLFARLGPDCGCDSMGDGSCAHALSRFLDALDRTDSLPKTILYNLNPCDGDMLATMIGNFQDGTTPGKLQYGSGWWFLDQMDGMERQLNTLSNQGILSRFVGMLTDSRSFLSFTRHEYFRRILCNLLGTEMERGLLPCDFELVGKLVGDVCYGNANEYFGIGHDGPRHGEVPP